MVYSISQWILFGFLLSPLIFCYVSGNCYKFEEKFTCINGQIGELSNPSRNIKQIDVDNMNIYSNTIRSSVFDKFNKSILQSIKFAHCKIKNIKENAFSSMSGLTHLELNDNEISSIKVSWLKDISNLVYLNLANNKIKEIENDAYQYLTKVVDLRLSNNPLTCLDLTKLTSLQAIYLNNNKDVKCQNAIKVFKHEHNISGSLDTTWNDSIPDTESMSLDQNAKCSSSTVNVMLEIIFLSFLFIISKYIFIDHL